jgi:hypothetical protein
VNTTAHGSRGRIGYATCRTQPPVGAAAVVLGPAGLADLPPGPAAHRGAQLFVGVHNVIINNGADNVRSPLLAAVEQGSRRRSRRWHTSA